MKFQVLTVAALSTAVAADAVSNPYVAPTSTDRRSPCPMLNAMANHGYLAHDGADISMADLITAFDSAINMAADAAQLVGALALTTSTTGNASTFHLDDVSKHGIIEHDSSLSRADIYFGDNHSFNQTVWAGTKAYFTKDTISIDTAARARAGRLAKATIENPTLNFTSAIALTSAIESALYLTVFGEPVAGNAVTKYVTSFFEQEQLPYALGWTRPTTVSNVATLKAMAVAIVSVNTTTPATS